MSGPEISLLKFGHRNAALSCAIKATPKNDKKTRAVFQSQKCIFLLSVYVIIDINVLCAHAHMVPPQCHSIHGSQNNGAYCTLDSSVDVFLE